MRVPFSSLSQVVAVTGVSLSSMHQRLGVFAVTAINIAGVVVVLVGMLAMGQGFRATLAGSGRPDTAVVLRSGASSETSSMLARDTTEQIAQATGVKVEANEPLASSEVLAVVSLPGADGRSVNVSLRGVEPIAFRVRPSVRISDGRTWRPGVNEAIVGSSIARALNLRTGDTIAAGNGAFKIVGVFEAPGTVSASEIWCDLRDLQSMYRFDRNVQAVYVRLESAEAFETFRGAVAADPRLDVQVLRESDYYAAQAVFLHRFITGIGALLALAMGTGAVFAAINATSSAVSARTREIATLKVIGYGPAPLAVSVIVEALLVALLGGAIGAVLAYAAFQGLTATTMNWQSFSQLSFAFRVTPAIIATALIHAVALGGVAAVPAAIRAVRLPIRAGLRD